MAKSWADILKAALPEYLRKREEEAARMRAAAPELLKRLRSHGRWPWDPDVIEPDVIVNGENHEGKK
jgi:hypothetical protein